MTNPIDITRAVLRSVGGAPVTGLVGAALTASVEANAVLDDIASILRAAELVSERTGCDFRTAVKAVENVIAAVDNIEIMILREA